jgi:hypothetical protein
LPLILLPQHRFVAGPLLFCGGRAPKLSGDFR